MLEPSYRQGVDVVLDKIENDDSRRDLWNAIVAVLDLICDHPESKEARRRSLTTTNGYQLWLVPIRIGTEIDDWCVLWAPDGEDAVIFYVGPWPPSD